MNLFHRAPTAPPPRVLRKKREETRDMARSRSEEGEVLFFSLFLQVTYEVGEFFCSPGLPFTFNSGFYAITSFSSSVTSLMERRFT